MLTELVSCMHQISAFHTFFCCLLNFSKSSFSKNYFRNTIRVSNSLDPEQVWRSVDRGYQNTATSRQGIKVIKKNKLKNSYHRFWLKLVITRERDKRQMSITIVDSVGRTLAFDNLLFTVLDIHNDKRRNLTVQLTQENFCAVHIWANTRYLGTYRISEQRMFRRACTYAQYHQSLGGFCTYAISAKVSCAGPFNYRCEWIGGWPNYRHIGVKVCWLG